MPSLLTDFDATGTEPVVFECLFCILIPEIAMKLALINTLAIGEPVRGPQAH
jgi:hypothetical protein